MVENQIKEDSHEIKTNITDAVVFLDGARVTRISEEISIEKGINILKVGQISKFLEKDSVRVKGSGKGIKATLVDVEVNYVYKEVTGLKELDELQEKLKQLQKERASLNEEKNHLSMIQENFKNIVNNFTAEFPKFFAAGESELQNLKDMHAYSNESILDMQRKMFELDEKIEKNSIEIDKVNLNIRKLGGQAQRVEEYYDVLVTIEAESAGPFQLNILYQIRGASWTPSYDVLISETETMINYRAEVVNKTLEDWEDINLEISTATFKPVRIIEPEPWYIQEYQPYDYYSGDVETGRAMAKVSKKMKREAAKMDELATEVMAPPEPEPVEMKIEQAAFSEGGFGVQIYKIKKKMDIKADGSKHPVLLQEIDVTSTRLFYWNSIDQQLVAQEKIKNGESVLLPGKVKTYVEGDFVGETAFDKPISPSEEFKLGARRSYEMKVEKKLTKREVGKKGLMKGKLTNEYGYEIKINNYRKKESDITVIDRIPHSRSAEIDVDPEQKEEKRLDDFFSPVPTKFQLGIATYELKLKPEEEFKIIYDYKVNYKKDIVVDPPLP
ncbi:MAG: mucoidy inhibitor MuiA family protein [Candidatus Helarchaeota archaeon]|nr:mucoidy inhibitor MuiA family protein [Candidatus Helarchaeota archaeon]